MAGQVVHAVGEAVTLFRPGDAIWYAGAIGYPGCNSEFQLVDERIASHKPASLGFAPAAALPLTSLTAWEILFDRLQVSRDRSDQGPALLVIGAAGGVGSILVQLARQLAGLTVIGTASRPETAAWLTQLGAHHVIDHGQPLDRDIARLALPPVRYVAALNQTDRHFDAIVELIAPQGRLAVIDAPEPFDARKLKVKSVSLHWEWMCTRSLFQTDDMRQQHAILAEVAQLVDAGVLKTTQDQHFGTINAAKLKRAHQALESNTVKGKIVLEGF